MTSPYRRPAARLGVALVAIVVVASLGACGSDDDAASSTTSTIASDPTETSADVPSELAISDQWVRPVADLTATTSTAAYMLITGGPEDDALLGASVDPSIAGTVEIHETTAADDSTDDGHGDSTGDGMDGGMDGEMETTVPETTMPEEDDHGDGSMGGGMMTMHEVERIEIPAGTTVELAPGGYHVMMMDVQRTLNPGDTIDITLTFEVAGEVVITAEVREP